ncbi:unnamed protein product [Knipowitschia caucasica]
MEVMVKNISSAVELLAVAAHSDTVAQWDEDTLSRALHWALYCEHLHNRFHHNSAIRKVLEMQLQITNESLSPVFPDYTALCFGDLSRCQNLLLDGILRNIHVPVSIMKTLFDKPALIINSQTGYQDARGICSAIIERKSACKVLRSVGIPSTVGPEAEVQAELLLEKLGGHSANQFLDSVLQGCEETQEHFCDVIGAALKSDGAMDKCVFLLDWLDLKRNFLENMCRSLPLSLLADLAKKHLRFRDMYIDVLTTWGKDMEYDLNNREWVSVNRSPSISFQNLTEHFVSLCKGSDFLKEHLQTELKALKFSDGDFDVRGLSVWGDLLSSIIQRNDTLIISKQP